MIHREEAARNGVVRVFLNILFRTKARARGLTATGAAAAGFSSVFTATRKKKRIVIVALQYYYIQNAPRRIARMISVYYERCSCRVVSCAAKNTVTFTR